MDIFIFVICLILSILFIVFLISILQIRTIEKELNNWEKYKTLAVFKIYKKQGINALKEQYKNCERFLELSQYINDYNYKYNPLIYYINKDDEKRIDSYYYFFRCLKYLITKYFIKKKIIKEV